MPSYSESPLKYRDDGIIVHVRDGEGIEVAAFVGPRRVANARLFCASSLLLTGAKSSAEMMDALVAPVELIDRLGDERTSNAKNLLFCLGVLRQVIAKAEGLDVPPQQKD
jgi:hypothetical protein